MGELTALPRPLIWIKGGLLIRGKRGEEGTGRKGVRGGEKKGKDGDENDATGTGPPTA